MALKTERPTYTVKLPSTGQDIEIVPFIVKDEKLLLMALESGSEQDIINATKQTVTNCIMSKGVNINNLPFFDVDYLFIAMRAKSVGESIEIKYRCLEKVDKVLCNTEFGAKVDITNCKIVKKEGISDTVELPKGTTIKMKYPSYTAMKTITDDTNALNKKIRMIVASIEYVKQGAKINSAKDLTAQDLTSFVESLTQEQFRKLEVFIDNFPGFLIEAKAKCPKCGFDHNLEYTDFTSFFV